MGNRKEFALTRLVRGLDENGNSEIWVKKSEDQRIWEKKWKLKGGGVEIATRSVALKR